MSDSTSASISYASPAAAPNTSGPIFVGGAMGIGAAIVGTLIFVTACFGYSGAFVLSAAPLALGAVGLIVTVFGGIFSRKGVDDASVMAALFLNVLGIVGGLLEVSAWQGWKIFH